MGVERGFNGISSIIIVHLKHCITRMQLKSEANKNDRNSGGDATKSFQHYVHDDTKKNTHPHTHTNH